MNAEAMPACSVAIIIPARNEAEIIERSTLAALEQGSLVTSLIVVDDDSEDETTEILGRLSQHHHKLQVLKGHVLESGDCGKPSALAWAYEQSVPNEEWILFIDADVVLKPGTLEYLLGWAHTHGCDVVSGYPEQKFGSALEKIVMPSIMALIGASYPFEKVMDASSEVAFANGQLILVRRDYYEKIGGHGIVKNQVLEDVALAKLLKGAGAKLGLVDLRGRAETRMYATQAELIEGWSKNLYLLLSRNSPKTIVLSLLIPLVGCSGFIAFLTLPPSFGAVALFFVTSMQMLIRFLLKVPLFWGCFSSLASLYLSFLLLRSMFLHLVRNRVPWKGRDYQGSVP
ncbi:MAG: glycosyltransferase family 2 protein [Myxococcota bacterium]|nr:glycosyltransferase family 2 protein [Myxococcota bacterium]